MLSGLEEPWYNRGQEKDDVVITDEPCDGNLPMEKVDVLCRQE